LCGSASELATLRSTTSKHDVNGGGGVNGLERRASSTDPVHDHDHHIDVFVAAPTPVASHPSSAPRTVRRTTAELDVDSTRLPSRGDPVNDRT
jgi:hypothetical protein